ncbi:MAG: nitroreductase family protein [Desulfosudaceae bacterium]
MISLLRHRRSVRRYLDQAIDPEIQATLKEALLRSPSSRNIRPWEFVWVEDKAVLEKLSRSKPHGASFLKDAALGIVICGDSGKSDVWIEDCSIAAVIAHLTAFSLGLGSCWVQIRNRDHDGRIKAGQYVREILDLPDSLEVEAVIAVGYPAEEKEGVPLSDLPDSKIRPF